MSSRPPPQGNPPSYALVNRVYKRSLRPVVIGTCILGALWSLIWGIASLRDISVDNDNLRQLVIFDIIFGILYLTIFGIQVLGVIAAYTRRLALVRIFAFAQLGAALIVLATAVIRVVLHYVFKSDLINECADLATGDTIVTRYGFFGPTTTTILNGQDAHRLCSNAWSRAAFSEIIWLIIAPLVGLFFATVAYSFYRQILDPTSPENVDRRPNAVTGPPPAHYAPPYAGGYGGGYGGGYNSNGYGFGQGPYAPPQGPPPMPPYDGAKLPEYEGNGVDGPEKLTDPFADDGERRGDRAEGSRDRT